MSHLLSVRARRSRPLAHPLAWPLYGIALSLAFTACGRPPTPIVAPSVPEASSAGEQPAPWSEERAPQLTSLSLATPSVSLSDLGWTSAASGYGPIEHNKSNGEKSAGDGHTISLNGKTYASGYGVHSNSNMVFPLPTGAATFAATVGVDDEVGKRGSVVFRVFADGQKLYDSGVMRGGDPSKNLSVDVTGKKQLQLAVLDAGDNLDYDHADWAGATLTNAQGGTQTGDQPSAANDKLFPADALVNVVTQYGAIPNDGKDDTAALQKAINENAGKQRVLYLPSGTYNISNTLTWKNSAGAYAASLSLQGQNQDKTILKLADGAFGGAQKAVLFTASNSADSEGQGNNAFDNHIFDLTVDTGRNNPGAVGIDYVANNCAAIRNVTIRSGDGQGRAGLGLLRTWPGPLLVKHVRVEGFNYGVQVQHDAYTQTFEDLTLKGQRVAGMLNAENVLTIRKLTSVNSVPAILNTNPNGAGVVTLLDANLTGGAANVSAIDNMGSLYARGVTTGGYASAVKNVGVVVPGANLPEYTSDPRVDTSALKSDFRLDVQETPEFHDNNLANWVNVKAMRTNWTQERDDSDVIQAAIDSGKSTLYFPSGVYRIGKTIHIRGNVRRLVGFGAIFDIATGSQAFGNSGNPQPVLRVENGAPDTVAVEGFTFADWNNAPSAGLTWVEHAAPRALVLRDLDQMANGNSFYRNASGAGKLFVENVASILPWHFDSPQDVWARQMNPENHNATVTNTLITKNGGKLWLLGLKTEDPRTVLAARGGEVELLGGLLYPVSPVPQSMPAFSGDTTKFKLSYTTLQYNNPEYQVHVKDGGRNLMRGVMPVKNHHAEVALYLGQYAAPAGIKAESVGGNGLKAEYFDNAFFTGDFTNLKTTRIDPTVSFDWGFGKPGGTALTSADTFSVRWTGQLQAPASGTYTFSVQKDPNAKLTLWVGGQKMDGGNGKITLSAGQKYDIRAEYAHMNYASLMKLAWSLDGSLPQIIPSSQLFPAR